MQSGLSFCFFHVFNNNYYGGYVSVFGYVETTGQIYLFFIIAFGMAGMNIVDFT